MRLAVPVLLLAVAVVSPEHLRAQDPAPDPGIVFTDVTKAAGIEFVHSFGDSEMSSILEATGSSSLPR